MSVVLAALITIGIAANVVGALAVIVPCLAIVGLVTWAMVSAG